MVNTRFQRENKFERFGTVYFSNTKELRENKIKACYLGNYIPWDVRKQVEIIKKELDWKGDEVEGIPENYDYEKLNVL